MTFLKINRKRIFTGDFFLNYLKKNAKESRNPKKSAGLSSPIHGNNHGIAMAHGHNIKEKLKAYSYP